MKSEDLIKAIESQYDKSRDVFFSYAWRKCIGECLTDENKYARLVDWINKKIKENLEDINIYNPADRNEKYTNGFFESYCNACKELAMLINLKWIMLDDRCSLKMRENIEYTICKVFNIKFDSKYNMYIP